MPHLRESLKTCCFLFVVKGRVALKGKTCCRGFPSGQKVVCFSK